MELIRIGGVKLPSPTKYDLKLSDIDAASSGRGETGYMTRDRVRQNVASIDVGWTMITTEELNTIKSTIENAEFSVTFFVGGSVGYASANMYVGDRTIKLKTLANDEEHWDVSFSLIEL